MHGPLLTELVHQTAAHVHSLVEDGILTRQHRTLALRRGPDLFACLARMDAPRRMYHNMLVSTDLVASIVTALGAVRNWRQVVVTDMQGYQPQNLRRPASRVFSGRKDKDAMERFVRLRLDEAATLPRPCSLRCTCA